MSFFSLIIALLIEQLRPVPAQTCVLGPLRSLSTSISDRFRDADGAPSRRAWLAIVVVLGVGSALLYGLIADVHGFFAFLASIVVLWLCMGFRSESRAFEDIRLALRLGEIERARMLLGQWRGGRHDDASAEEVARLAIEQALVAAHRTVFGVGFWFVVLGPVGAVLYRTVRFLAEDRAWRANTLAPAFDRRAQRALELVEWLPVRLTAAAFTVVGNFEDALYCWRTQSALWPDKASAILIASGAGALGVRLGMPAHESGSIVDRPEMGTGSDASVDHMQSTVGLVWRALLVCLFLLALIGVVGWVSR